MPAAVSASTNSARRPPGRPCTSTNSIRAGACANRVATARTPGTAVQRHATSKRSNAASGSASPGDHAPDDEQIGARFERLSRARDPRLIVGGHPRPTNARCHGRHPQSFHPFDFQGATDDPVQLSLSGQRCAALYGFGESDEADCSADLRPPSWSRPVTPRRRVPSASAWAAVSMALPTCQMHREVVHRMRAQRTYCASDRPGDVMQLQIQEDLRSASGPASLDHLGTVGAEEFEPDLVDAEDVLGPSDPGPRRRGCWSIQGQAKACVGQLSRPSKVCTTTSGAMVSTSPFTRGLSSTTPFFETPGADGDTPRRTDQFGVLKLHARALFAIVQHHLNPCRQQFIVDPFGGLDDIWLVHLERQDRHLVGRKAGAARRCRFRRGSARPLRPSRD